METETIDLTHPLEDMLKQRNWTPECINELLYAENANATKKGGSITLNGLLYDYEPKPSNKFNLIPSVSAEKISTNKNKQTGTFTLYDLLDEKSTTTIESLEIVELSDDETDEVPDIKGENTCESTENFTEVQVVELSDFSDQDSCESRQNEEDDDPFEEASLNSTASISKRNSPTNFDTSGFLFVDCNGKSPEIDIDKSESCETELLLLGNNENVQSKSDEDSQDVLKESDIKITNFDLNAISKNDSIIISSNNQPNDSLKKPDKDDVASLESGSENNQFPYQTLSHESVITKESITNAPVETTLASLEEIRKNLKLQLTNLRTKKKTDMLKDVKQTVIKLDKLQQYSNKVTDDTNLLQNNEEAGESKIKTNIIEPEKIVNNQLLFDQTDNAVDSQDDDNVPNVFNEIRKIIRKSKDCSSKSNVNNTIVNFKKSDSEDLSNETPPNDDLTTTISGPMQSKNTNNVSSPFVSETLDEFLTDSKLNVSYTIPKSGAEEGLRIDYSVEPVVSFEPNVKEETREKIKEELKYKPKTLAEKRRFLEKNMREQRRLAKLKTRVERRKKSYVLFRNKKIFLQTNSVGKCVASIESDVSDAPPTPPKIVKKPSLLTSFYRKSSSIKYKPGPLSKKHLLQTDYSQWTTEPKQLPKVVLNIMPQLGKPVHPNLLPIVFQGNGEITKNQAEFALSALATKPAQSPAIFRFDVPYQNRQENVLVRKKIADNNDTDIKIIDQADSNPDGDIAQLLDNLIKYIEIKEIASSLIKEDKDLITPADPTSSITNNNNESLKSHESSIIKKKSFRKLSRTSKELLRLNCKVVSMEVKESDSNSDCSKPYCRLGCICSSLECKSTIRLHCQKIKCIFGCLCPKENNKIISISVPTKITSGSENLSTDTVTRIEDEAKKNLAKIEREFTQTIIYTNDKTIVVGVGNKPRRAARTPKKYCDFFDEDALKINLENKKTITKPCFVSLEKWDLSDVVPYCLAHNLYNCHCNGHGTLIESNYYSTQDSVKEEQKYVVNNKQAYKRKIETSQSDGHDASGRPPRKKKPNYKTDYDYCDNIWLPEKNTISQDSLENPSEMFYCSRTCRVPKQYFTTKIVRRATDMDFGNNITEADILKMELKKNDDILDNDKLKIQIIEQQRELVPRIKEKDHRKTHQRKQQIEVRQDEDLKFKTIISVKKPKRIASSVFPGEIIVNDAEWIKKLCSNSKQQLDSYARILPWNALIKGFLAKSINVYCICDMPLRLLLNVGEKLTGDKISDIEMCGHSILETPLKGKAPWLISQSENVRDIIKWLLSGTLPSKYKTTTPSFLLVETVPDRFEVRGICTQNETKPMKHNETEQICDEITEIKHKNMDNEVESLFITKQKFRLRELVEDGFDDDLTDNLYMWVGLPDVYKVGKWRVIFLKNDFVYLYFKTIRYSIKYSDLVKLTEMAKEEKLTLLVRNLQIRRSYEHSLFGLYVSPIYRDRIFIGPYFIKYDGDDIETLKYMNESLISSESFNKMKGNPNQQCGHWMYERPYNHTPKNFLKETIDLTHDDSSTITISSSENKPVLQRQRSLSTNGEHIIMHNGCAVFVKNSKPRSPAEFNRYIITNIPHFGYLGAFQPENSSILEVSWPFEKKVLEFQNADHARDFLQERFNQLLQPVPETFKIQVIVLISLDLNEHQPVNSDFLTGQCICGYFGTYNFKEVTDEFCKNELKTTKEEIIKLFAKRAQEFIRKKICELAEITGVSTCDKANFNVGYILNKAKEEIKKQEHLRIKQIAEIHSTESKVIHNIKKIFTNIKKLPVRERNIESRILNETVQIRPKRFGVNNEVIEIKDEEILPASDSELEKKDETVHPKPLENTVRKESVLRTYKPKIAKVAPFSATSILLVNKANLKPPDKPDCDEKCPLGNS